MVTNLLNSCKKSLEHWWRSCEISAYLFGISCIFLEQRLVGLGGVMELVFTLKNVLKTCRPLQFSCIHVVHIVSCVFLKSCFCRLPSQVYSQSQSAAKLHTSKTVIPQPRVLTPITPKAHILQVSFRLESVPSTMIGERRALDFPCFSQIFGPMAKKNEICEFDRRNLRVSWLGW